MWFTFVCFHIYSFQLENSFQHFLQSWHSIVKCLSFCFCRKKKKIFSFRVRKTTSLNRVFLTGSFFLSTLSLCHFAFSWSVRLLLKIYRWANGSSFVGCNVFLPPDCIYNSFFILNFWQLYYTWSSQSILKEINTEYLLDGLMLKLKLQFDHLMWRTDSLGKTLMLGKIVGRRRGRKEDEMVGWHHQLNGHEFEQALGNGEGQGSLACCSPWGHKESDMIEQLCLGEDLWYNRVIY